MVSPMNFPILSYEQANPFFTGMQQGNDVLSGVLKNMYAPHMLKQQLRHEQLANAMSQENLNVLPERNQRELEKLALGNTRAGIENQYLPQEYQSQIGLRNAQTQGHNISNRYAPEEHQAAMRDKLLQYQMNRQKYENPGLGMAGLPGLAAASEFYNKRDEQQNPEYYQSNPQVQGQQGFAGAQGIVPEKQTMGQTYKDLLNRGIAREENAREYEKTRTARTKQLMASKSFNSMPVDSKRTAIAQAVGFGYDQYQATKMLAEEGKTLQDLAEEAGYGKDKKKWPEAKYNASMANITREQRQAATFSALEAVEPEVSKAIAPYSATAFGYSPKAIGDLQFGNKKEKERVADYLAAIAMSPEIAGLRLTGSGANVGITAIKEMTEAALTKAKIPQALMKPEVFQMMQDRMQHYLKIINNKELESYLSSFKPRNEETEDLSGYNTEDLINMFMQGGG